MAQQVPPEGEENSEPLTYKKWVLKVSIHCEGCKRKVKRILHSIEGVYTIDVDTKQHKVTVTGNVDSNTLLKKLEKSGKHAELWPDAQGKNPNRNEDEQNQGNQNQTQNPTVEKENVTVNVEEAQKNNDEPSAANGNPKGPENSNSGQQTKEVRFEGNIPANGENPSPAQNPPQSNAGPGKSGGKKKKKKGHKGNNTNNNNTSSNSNNCEQSVEQQPCNGRPPSSEPAPNPDPNPNPSPVNMSPPRQPQYNRVYEYPPAYYAPPPIDGVSYSTAYPTSTYTSSYYSAPAAYSYAYVHHAPDVEQHASSDWNSPLLQPSDTLELFSDENPNACSVM